MSAIPEVHVQATRYEVSALAAADIGRRQFTLYVEWRGDGRWAVADGGGQCLGADGEWSWESIPSERADEWLNSRRFDLDTALELARQAAPKITVNGFTVADAMAMQARRNERDGATR